MRFPSTRTLASLAAAAVLAGCSMIPVQETPAAPVAGSFPYPSDAAGPGAPDIDWQTFFVDEQLKRLIASSLQHNRDMRTAVLNIELARAQYNIRNADRYPTVNAVVAGSRVPGANGNQTSLYTAGLAVTAWEIDFFGRLASLSEVALAQYLATEEGRKAFQITLVASVANSYLSLIADQEQLAIAQQTLKTREETLRLIRLRFEHGVTSELDVRQAESLAESARVVLHQNTRQRALDENTLVLLTGAPLPPGFAAAATTEGLSLPDLPSGTPSEVLVRRPDIRQSEQLLIAANANIGAARAAFFPRISLTAGVGTASNELSGLFQGGSWGFTMAPQLLLPIFDAGRNEAGLRAATVTREIAIAQYERAIQLAFREVADSLAGRATLGEQLEATRNAARAEAARLRLAELRYLNGVASFLDLLDAQRANFLAQILVVQTRLAQLQNQVLLYKALGGGWKEAS